MKTTVSPTTVLVLQAYWILMRFDYQLARRDFAAIRETIRSLSVRTWPLEDAAAKICRAVDLACIFYCKQVHCLQRSAATAYLLKKHGVPATLVLGAQHSPFKAHAWVEICGRVVNDKPYTPEIYAVLDRV